jgi:hypothetical protein
MSFRRADLRMECGPRYAPVPVSSGRGRAPGLGQVGARRGGHYIFAARRKCSNGSQPAHPLLCRRLRGTDQSRHAGDHHLDGEVRLRLRTEGMFEQLPHPGQPIRGQLSQDPPDL